MSEIRDFLERQRAAGPWALGQIAIAPELTLRHVEDPAPTQVFTRPEDAREIAKYDDAGAYRPLKTAPNLRRGWELRLTDLAQLHLALDFFYPAALGNWLAYGRGAVEGVPLRVTLGRQTGMYRVTQLIRDDQAEALVAKTCGEGCLRRRLWGLAAPARVETRINGPALLCVEACNLLVAACRPLAKENLPKT